MSAEPREQRWTFSAGDLDEVLDMYEHQGEGDAQGREHIARAVRAFLRSPYGQCLRDRKPQPEHAR